MLNCSSQFCTQLVEKRLIEEKAIFIDGTKIEVNANKYAFAWEKSIDNFDKKLTEKSTFLYDELVKNTIIPEIKRVPTEELAVAELGQIEKHLAQVMEKITGKRSARSGKFLKKSENYFMTSKKVRLSKTSADSSSMKQLL